MRGSILVCAVLLFGASDPPRRDTAQVQEEFMAAVAAAQRGETAKAEPVFRELTEQFPEFAPAWIELAALLRWSGRTDQALVAADQAARVAPDHPLPALERARALLALGRPAEAVAAFRRSITRRDLASTRLELASLYGRLRQGEQAEKEVRAALVLDPKSAKAHGALGRVLFFSKRYGEAVQAFAEAEAMGLRDISLMIEHGAALESLARLEPALTVYESASVAAPGDARPRLRRGTVLIELDRSAAAVAPLTEALAVAPDDVDVMERLGHALARSGRADQAIEILKRAVVLAPKLATAHYTLGTVLAETGRDAEAAVALERFHELHRQSDDHSHREGKIATMNRQGLEQLREGKALDAIDTFEAAIRLGPSQGAVHKNLGLALLGAGNPEGAVEAFRQAQAIDGESEPLSELIATAKAKSAPAP